MQVTQHFKTAEFERSQTAARAGISTTILPNSVIFQHVQALCRNVLEPLRAQIGRPIIISSGYRPPALNVLIGGAENSQHCLGEAADIHTLGITDYDLAKIVKTSALPFDQLIYEFGRWVHVSYNPAGAPRGDLFTAYKDADGKTHYAEGIVPIASIKGAQR